MKRWRYMQVSKYIKEFGSGTYGAGAKFHFVVVGDPERTFDTADEALAVLGEEGWECYHIERSVSLWTGDYTLFLKQSY